MKTHAIAAHKLAVGRRGRILGQVQVRKLARRLGARFLRMAIAWALAAAYPATAQLVNVTTYHNDNSRRGLND